jgi:hypothetical protein
MAVEEVGIRASVENVSGFSSALNAMIAKIVALGSSSSDAAIKSAIGFARLGNQLNNVSAAYGKAQIAAAKLAEQEVLGVQRANQARAQTRITHANATVAEGTAPSRIATFASNAAAAATRAAATVSISNNKIAQSAADTATATAVGANKIAASVAKTSTAIIVGNNQAAQSAANTATATAVGANKIAASAAKTSTAIIVGNNQAAQSAVKLATTQQVSAQQIIQANNATKASAAQLAAAQVSAHNQIKLSNAQTSAGMKEMSTHGNAAAKAIDNIAGSAKKAKGPLGVLGTALATAIGFLGANIAQSIGNVISQAVGTAYTATRDYQTSQVGILSLISREFTRMGETSANALQKADKYAKIFMDDLSDVAIMSPYPWQQVQETFRMSMAFGNTAKEALQFTKDILNIAAGTGATADMLDRMAYNFSQISLVGKITWLDMRQLAQAGFDLGEVIQATGKKIGVAMQTDEEFNAAMEAGLITWKDFREALTEVAETKFAGASERMARTLQGLESNIKDFWVLTLPKLFGPASEELNVRFNAVFNKLRELRKSGLLEAIGLMIGEGFNNALNAVSRFVKGAASTIGGAIKSAWEWGRDLIINFAEGIIDATSGLLNTAFQFVSSIISYWLSPGSPPNVAPEVDQWGTSMAGEFVGGFLQGIGDLMASVSIPTLSGWFHGFGEADWDVFDTIKDNLTAVLDQLGSTDAVMLTADLAKYLSDIATTGVSTIDIIKRITEATADYGADMALLVKYQLEYDAATKLVEAADKRITANETKLTEQVREYNKARRAGTPAKLLRDKALAINATRDQIDADKVAKKQAEDNLTLLKKQMDMQEKIIKALLDFAKAQERAAEAAEHAREAGGKDGSADGIREPYRLSDFSDMVQKDIGAIRDKLKKQLEEMFSPFLPLKKKLEALWKVLNGYLTGIWEQLKLLWTQEIATRLREIGSIFRWWMVLWRKDGGKISGSLQSLINSIIYLGKSIVFWISDRVGEAYGVLITWLDKVGVWFDQNRDSINKAILGIRDAFDKVSEWVRGTGGAKTTEFLKLVLDYLLKGVTQALLLAGIFLKFATGDYTGAMKDIDDALGGIVTTLKNLGDNEYNIELLFKDGPDGKPSAASNVATAIKKGITDIGAGVQWVVDFLFKEGEGGKPSIASTIAATAKDVVEAAGGAISWAVKLLFFNKEDGTPGYAFEIAGAAWDIIADTGLKAITWLSKLLFVGDEKGEGAWLTVALEALKNTFESIMNGIAWNIVIFFKRDEEGKPTGLAETLDSIAKDMKTWADKTRISIIVEIDKNIESDAWRDQFINQIRTNFLINLIIGQMILDPKEGVLRKMWDGFLDVIFYGPETKARFEKFLSGASVIRGWILKFIFGSKSETAAAAKIFFDGLFDFTALRFAWKTFGNFWTTEVVPRWEGLWGGLDIILSTAWTRFTTTISAWYTKFLFDFDIWKITMSGKWNSFWTGISDWLANTWSGIVTTNWRAIPNTFLFDFDIWKITAIGRWNSFWMGISDWLANTWSAIVTANWTTIFYNIGFAFGKALVDFIFAPFDLLFGVTGKLITTVSAWYTQFLFDFDIWKITMSGRWNSFWMGISDWLANTWSGIVTTNWRAIPNTFLFDFDIWKITMSGRWNSFWMGISDWLANTWSGIVTTNWRAIPNTFLFDFDIWKITMSGKWNSFWTGISDWLANTWSAIVSTNWKAVLDSILTVLTTWYDENIQSLFDKGAEIMGQIIRGLAWAVSNMVGIGEAIVRGVFAGVLYELRSRFWQVFGKNPDEMAAGGVATGASNVIVGEAGAEAIIPLSSGRSIKMLARSLSAAMNMQVGMNSVAMPLGGMMGGGRSVVYNQNLYVNTTQQAVNVVQSFQSLKAMYGTY